MAQTSSQSRLIHRSIIWVVFCVICNVVGSLLEMMTTRHDNYVVTVAHVVEPADNSIIEHCFMSHSISVTKERISSLLVIGYHALTDRHHLQVPAFVLGLSIHRLPR